MKKLIPIVLVAATAWFVFMKDTRVTHGPGVLAPDDPVQEKIQSPKSFQFKDYTLTPLATFRIKAKVLSRKNYYTGREAELSPVDLALGWGNMSDESVLDKIEISQSNRWYKWWVDSFPIPKNEIQVHSANMHLIPADDLVDSAIGDAQNGDIVKLKGSLVRVDANDNWHWVSSLTRNDTGNHACELVWVESFSIVDVGATQL